MTVLIDNRQNRFRLSTEQIRKPAQAILNALGSAEGELSVLLLDDAAIAGLNQQYLGRPGPTNVIAFPMGEGDFADIQPELLGDVVISVDTAAKEAEELGISLSERIRELLIHGILHLFGYDHETAEADARAMEEKSEALLREIRDIDIDIQEVGRKGKSSWPD
ncbi:MAG: rRNA maturation RNase YbeY [Desulfosalsimonadaceae bacterium]